MTSCRTCDRTAPSQPALPPVRPPTPDHPFQLVSTDFFSYAGHNYLVLVDRYSNWPVIKKCQTEASQELISNLREYFCTFGVPKQLTSDGGPAYTAAATNDFLKAWGVDHRISTAYNPHANLRAETAVKSMKRLIMDNVSASGSLDRLPSSCSS